MDSAGIERALVSSLTAVFRQNVAECNEELRAALAPHRDRLIPLAVMNPGYPGWEADLSDCDDFAGIRLYPNYHGYHPVEAAPLVQAAAEGGRPVFVAVRLQDERQHHPACKVAAVGPESIVTLAKMVPSARMVATMVRFGEAERLLECGNVWVDISGIQGPSGCIERLASRFSGERLLFGSGIPLQYPLPNVMKLEMAHISDDERKRIQHENALRLAHIQHK
jgi:hypothetical protein